MFRGSFRGGSGGGGGGGTDTLVWDTVTTPGTYTISGTTNAVEADVSAGSINVQLPAASAHGGKVFTVKHTAGNLASNALTLSSVSGNIDDAASYQIFQTLSSTRVASNGTRWNII